MSITVVEGRFKTKTPFEKTDSVNDILAKYVIERKRDILPSYFRVKKRTDTEIEVENISRVLLTISKEDFEESLGNLLSEFPNLSKIDIVIIWLKKEFRNKKFSEIVDVMDYEYKDFLLNIDESFTLKYIEDLYQTYDKNLMNQLKKLKEHLKVVSKQKKMLNKHIIQGGKIKIVKITYSIKLDLPDKENLQEVFNLIDVNSLVPAVRYAADGDLNWYKLYQYSDLLLSEELNLTQELQRGGIYLFINLNNSKKLVNVFWSDSNRITYELDEENVENQDFIKNQILNVIGGRIVVNIIESGRDYVNGIFTVKDIVLNKAMFADMIFIDDFVSSFLQLKEVTNTFTKIGGKNIVYFRTFSSPIMMTFTPIITGEDTKALKIKVNKIEDEKDLENIRTSLLGILGYYKYNFQVVLNEYEKIYPRSDRLIEKENLFAHVEKSNKKSGSRLMGLIRAMPDVFESKYASSCQMGRQPRIINKKEADLILEKFEDGKDLVLKFPGDVETRFGKAYESNVERESEYFACISKEEVATGKIETKSLYPGLIKNKTSNADDYPYIPCCYIGPNRKQKIRAPVSGIQHIFASTKLLIPDRSGALPLYIANIVDNFYTRRLESKTGISNYPILRLGVILSPDSFLHCTEKALNIKYTKMSLKKKLKRVKTLRNELSKMDFTPASQELYEFSDSYIKEILQSGSYLDPQRWVRLVEIYYSRKFGETINIILFVIDDNHPNGEFAIPYHTKVYLMRDIKPEDKTLFIIKHKTGSKLYPYQCELIYKLNLNINDQIKGETLVFRDEDFQEMAINLYKRSNQIHVLGVDISNKCYTI